MKMNHCSAEKNDFEAVLNVRSTFVDTVIQGAHQYLLKEDMSEEPTAPEIFDILDSLGDTKWGQKWNITRDDKEK